MLLGYKRNGRYAMCFESLDGGDDFATTKCRGAIKYPYRRVANESAGDVRERRKIYEIKLDIKDN